MATLKSKQTAIATVRKHLRTVASLPTSLPFHYPLPLRVHKNENFFGFDFEFLYYFIVSYAKIIRFWGTHFLIGPLWGELRLFGVVLRL